MTIKQISDLISRGIDLKQVTQAYAEIASIRLRKIRSSVEKNRSFLDEISTLYSVIQKVALSKGVTARKNKKKLSLVLTSNYRFYGSINSDLIRFFLINTSKYQTDRIIIGKTALDELKAMKYFHPFFSIIFKEDLPTDEELRELLGKVKDYEQVFVYFSQYQSILVQTPKILDITKKQNVNFTTSPKTLKMEFILEPEIIKMLDFFDSQIMFLLLDQTFLESELARTASRLFSMNQAQDNANKFIRDQRLQLSSAKKIISNIQVLEIVSHLIQHKMSNK